MPDEQSPRAPYLLVDLHHSIGGLSLELRFQLSRPWTILFGPSGSGKTTLLRAIAGLVTPQAGVIRLLRPPEVTLFDSGATPAVNLSPHRRRTPLAPQAAALFPHLTVRQNLLFGGGSFGGQSAPFGTEHLLERLPARLSGGEARRVSLARAALVPNPAVLLLDEPFTGLEAPLREELIAGLLSWQRVTGTPILSVTHDVAEAVQLQAEVIKLHDGRVVDQGPAHSVLREERAALLRQLQSS